MCCWAHLHDGRYALKHVPEDAPLGAYKYLAIYIPRYLISPIKATPWIDSYMSSSLTPNSRNTYGVYCYTTKTAARTGGSTKAVVKLDIWGQVMCYGKSEYIRAVPAGYRAEHAKIVDIWLPSRVWDQFPDMPMAFKRRYGCEVHEL